MACNATVVHVVPPGTLTRMLFDIFIFGGGMLFGIVIILAVYFTVQWSRRRTAGLRATAEVESLSTEELQKLFSSKQGFCALPSIFMRPDIDKPAFMNDAMKILWPYINRAGTSWALEDGRLEEMMNEQTFWKPSWLAASGVILQSIYLGEVPPHVTGVKIYPPDPGSVSDALVADVSFDWVSKMMVQLTMKTLSGSDMSLIDRFLSIVYRGVGIKVVIRNLIAKGQLRIIAGPLLNRIPVVGSVRVSFLGAPETSYQVSSMGANPLMIPGLEAWLNSFIENSVLEPFMFPEGFSVDVSDLLGFGQSAIVGSRPEGLLDVTVKHARNLPNTDIFGLTDPYVKLYIQQKMKTRTTVKPNTLNPVWDENFEFIIYSKEHQKLMLQIYDSDILRADDIIGQVEVSLGDLDLIPCQSKDLVLSVPRIGKGEKKHQSESKRRMIPFTFRDMELAISITYFPFSSQEQDDAQDLSSGLRTSSSSSLTPRIKNILRGGMLYIKITRGELQSTKALLTVKYRLKVEIGKRSEDPVYSKVWERSGLGRGLSAQHPVFDAEVDFLVTGDIAQDPDTVVVVSVYSLHPIRRPTYKGLTSIPLSRVIGSSKIHDEFLMEGPKSGGYLEIGLEWLGIMEGSQ